MTESVVRYLSWYFVPPRVDPVGVIGRVGPVRAAFREAVEASYFAGVCQGLTAGIGLCLGVMLLMLVFRVWPFRWGES